jgi:hypothetical protein
MANQAIALQARAPSASSGGNVFAQNMQMMNMMAQRTAAERQAATSQQALDVSQAGEIRAAAEEARKAALQPSALAKGRAEATAEEIKTAQLFNNAVYTAAANSNSPEDFTAFAQRIAAAPQFQDQLFFGGLKTVLESMPTDPAEFPEWKRQTGIKTIANDKRYEEKLQTQKTGTQERIISIPAYGGGAATEVPGSRFDTAQDIQYVKGPDDSVRAMPKNMPGTGGFGAPAPAAPAAGLVGGARGGSTPVAIALQTNPGAIRNGSFTRSQPGYTGVSGGFATFDTPQAGIAAQENLLRKDYVGKGFNTIDKIISRYAPPGGENPPAAVANYKKYVAQQTGIDMNAPITAAQVPAVAAAMRQFETGQRPARAGTPVAAPAPAGVQTVAEAATQKALRKVLPIIGYNAETGASRVEDLIKESTSGAVQMIGSEIMGAVTGEGTPGRAALKELSAIADNMTFEKLRGKLGAQISDADVRLIARTMADIANGNEPANVRAAAWKNVVLPNLLRGAGMEPKTPTGGGKAAAPTASAAAPPTAAVQMLRKNPTPAERKMFDSVFGAGAAAKALGGR